MITKKVKTMRTTKFKTNIDKITICCIRPDSLFKELTKKDLIKDGYELVVVEKTKADDEETKIEKIVAQIIIQGSRLGVLTINASIPYAFITIENKALWTKFSCDYKGNFCNEASLILPILNNLELTVNNISSIEVCIDVNSAVKSRIKKAIKNVELDLYLNGKKVTSHSERLQGVLHIFERSRERILNNDTLYIKNSEGSAHFKIYDKSQELKESTNYKATRTEDWDGFTPKERLEITARKKHIREYMKYRNFECSEEFMDAIFYDEKERGHLFWWLARKLMYFKDGDGNIIDLIDFIEQ